MRVIYLPYKKFGIDAGNIFALQKIWNRCERFWVTFHNDLDALHTIISEMGMREISGGGSFDVYSLSDCVPDILPYVEPEIMNEHN